MYNCVLFFSFLKSRQTVLEFSRAEFEEEKCTDSFWHSLVFVFLMVNF